MKGTTLVAIVAIAVILVLTSVFIYMGLPVNNGSGPSNSIVQAPPETAELAYIVNFNYQENPILAGETQWINITITQGAYAASTVPGDLYVNAPNETNYQIFSFTTDSNGAADFTFPIAQNATAGTYNVFVIIGSLGQIIQNVSSTFSVVD